MCYRNYSKTLSKKSKLSISLDQQCIKFYTVHFYCIPIEYYWNILKLSYRPVAFNSYIKLFEKIENGLVLVSLPHFQHDFEEKRFSCEILLPNQISFSNCFYFLRHWEICVSQLFVNQVVTSYIDFQIRLIFLIKPFLLHLCIFCYNSNTVRAKRAFKIKKNNFLLFLNSFYWI